MSIASTAKDTIGRVLSTVFSGDSDTPSAVAHQSELNEDQKAKIAEILKEPCSENKEQPIAPTATPLSAMQSLQASRPPVTNEIYPDILGMLFYHIYQSDFTTLRAVACLNKHWNTNSAEFWAKSDPRELCPELTILDANAQGIKCEDEPKINKLQLLKWVKEIGPHVEGNAGVTQLTMTKGTTLNQLIEIAKGEGMNVEVLLNRIIKELGDVPVKQTYGILISNSVFIDSRDIEFNSQKKLIDGHGCKMPTVQEYVALCVFMNKAFKRCVYGQNPWAYGRSSTLIGNDPLLVGASTSTYLDVCRDDFSLQFTGAGGQRKF